MVHEWMQITLEVSDTGVVSGLLGTRSHYIAQTSYQNKELPIIDRPKGMSAQEFFFSHLKELESKGWEVFSIDMYHPVPWHAILRKPMEKNS
jgi:hypothetical protein